MIVDSEAIIKDTLDVFLKSSSQQKKFNSLRSTIAEQEYKSIHKNFLNPLNIKIDCDLFLKEIDFYSAYFEQWGKEHTHLPRYGLALVNQDGILKRNDPINGSLYEWNKNFPDSPLLESDCRVPTQALTLGSLEPLKVFENYWTRSNILKWHTGAEFKPHIDTVIPSPWIRLWGTTDPEKLKIRCVDNNTKTMLEQQHVEAGRIYVIDTSLVHDAVSYGDNTYQFFLSVSPEAFETIKGLMI